MNCHMSDQVAYTQNPRSHPHTGRIIRGSLRTCPVGVSEARKQRTQQCREKLTCREDPNMAKHMRQACQWHLSKQNEYPDKRGGTGMCTLCPTLSQPHKSASQQQASNSNLPCNRYFRSAGGDGPKRRALTPGPASAKQTKPYQTKGSHLGPTEVDKQRHPNLSGISG